jgi:hypothetical protein
MAQRARLRRWNMVCRLGYTPGERGRGVAARAVAGLWVVGVLRCGGPIDHRHAEPAHAALVTRGARYRGHRRMIHCGAAESCEVRARMTALAGNVSDGNMICRGLPRRNIGEGLSDAVASCAAACDARMVEARGYPADRHMADVTLFTGRDMVGRLAGRLHIVVTTGAVAENLCMVEIRRRIPRRRRVAGLAAIGTHDVACGFAERCNAGTHEMTAGAVTRCSLENGIHVARFTRHFAVCAVELKARGQMVKCLARRSRMRRKRKAACQNSE